VWFSLAENHEKVCRSPDFLRRGTGREQRCATFFEESRMQFASSNNIYRKSGFGLHQLRTALGFSDSLRGLAKDFFMVEPRARKYHRDRVAETLREEISGMIVGELADPRISFAYVSEVVINPGGKSARVYIAVDGGEVEEEKTREALTAARGFIRHELLERMGVRHVPELSFQIDKSKHLKLRIDELLGRNRKTQKADAKETPPKPQATATAKE
jgi:ribosome-binding factor A